MSTMLRKFLNTQLFTLGLHKMHIQFLNKMHTKYILNLTWVFVVRSKRVWKGAGGGFVA
jgi:hypothetical protein